VIDIMIPFWGEVPLLFEAIESVRRQTDPDWRLTVVDDCYPEPVGDRIAALGDPRIHYTRNERNLGITDNYRRCVELATAERVTLFGCDDIMLANFVATVAAAAARHPDASIIAPSVEVIDETGRVYRPLRDRVKATLVEPKLTGPLLLAGEAAARRLLWGNWLYWPSLTFRRDALLAHDFRDDFPIIQDLALILDIIADGGSLLCLPEVAFRYRRHSASASAASSLDGRRFRGERRYLALAADLMASRGWPRAARQARLHLLSRLDAVTVLPAALWARQWDGVKTLLTHIVAP
jgi:glycosyltransferase involved in cell wall biosynthesis